VLELPGGHLVHFGAAINPSFTELPIFFQLHVWSASVWRSRHATVIPTIICHHGTCTLFLPLKQLKFNSKQVFLAGVSFGDQKLVKVSLADRVLSSILTPYPPIESPRVLLCSWAHSICPNYGKILDSQARQGRIPRSQNRHLHYGRIITNDYRNGRPPLVTREYSTTKGYGIIPG
jgi:hypothetical protein